MPTPKGARRGWRRGWAPPFGRWRISRTPAGADVLTGRADCLALSPLDRRRAR